MNDQITALEARKILNDNSRGKFYSVEEAICVLKLCTDLASILEDHPIEKLPVNQYK